MPPEIRGVAPLFQVFDMPTSIAFYRDVLEFEVLTTSAPDPHFDWALLKLNGVELMLNTAYEHDQRPPAPIPPEFPRTRTLVFTSAHRTLMRSTISSATKA